MPVSRRVLLASSCLLVAAFTNLADKGFANAQQPVRIGFSDSPPISLRDSSGQLKGFAVSTFAAAAANAGITIHQDLVSFGDLLSGLTEHRFDVVVMSPTPERRKSAIFTQPLVAYGEMLIVRAEDPVAYSSLKQLKGKTVGSNAGGGWIDAVRDAGGTIKTYPAAEQTLAALEAGEVDAVVGNAPTYRYLLKTRPHAKARIAESYKPVQVNELSFAVRPGDEALRDRLNTALQALQQAGVTQKLRMEWGF